MSSRGRAIRGGGGRIVWVGPNELHIKAAEETGHELLGCFDSLMPPGDGFPFPHQHDQYEEAFFVIEGTIEYLLGDEWAQAPAGTTISVPRGVVHAFRNNSAAPARHLVMHAPASAVRMVEELSQAPPEQWAEVLERHHSRFVEPVAHPSQRLQ
jgi:uncharacterized RmlC-like cupin family protein